MDNHAELKKIYDQKERIDLAFDTLVSKLHQDGVTVYRLSKIVGRSSMYIIRSLIRTKTIKPPAYAQNR